MASVGGSFPSLGINSYPTNTLTNGIYDVPGTLQDWAYAASWEVDVTRNISLIKECISLKQVEQNPDLLDLGKVGPHDAKALFYLIQASDDKNPSQKSLGA